MKGKWRNEFSRVLWATPKVIIGENPFYLVCRTEAVVPYKVQEHTVCFDISNMTIMTSEERTCNWQKKKENALIRIKAKKLTVQHAYNKMGRS